MPAFTKYINEDPINYGVGLAISGFSVSNESPNNPNLKIFEWNNSLPFFTSGSFSQSEVMNREVLISSGKFYSDSPVISWGLVNPDVNSLFSKEEIANSRLFQGFALNLKSETGQLIHTFNTGSFTNTSFQLPVQEILNYFSNFQTDFGLRGADLYKTPNPRRFQFEVVSNDFYGRKKTGVFLLTSDYPDVIDLDIGIGTNLTFDIDSSKKSGVNSVTIYSSNQYFKDFLTDPSGVDTNFAFTSATKQFDNILLDNYGLLSLTVGADPRTSNYYSFVLADNFGTGAAYYYPSSIKPFSIDSFKYNAMI